MEVESVTVLKANLLKKLGFEQEKTINLIAEMLKNDRANEDEDD